MTADRLKATERSRLRRLPKRGSYDRRTIYSILDATPMCHVAYLVDGRPVVTPTLHWREGNRVYWHGSRLSRALLSAEDHEICLTVSLLDGLVLARSGFHHSANYRSAMVFGRPTKIDDRQMKSDRLKTFMERLYPGRWDELRPMTRKELNATTVLSLPIEEASAKVREGGPVDDEEDYALPIWAGVVPVTQSFGIPEADPRNRDGVSEPAYLRGLRD